MRIVCSGCAAKYSVEDHLVSGKNFQARCKKCGDMMRVCAPRGALMIDHGTPQATRRDAADEVTRSLHAPSGLEDTLPRVQVHDQPAWADTQPSSMVHEIPGLFDVTTVTARASQRSSDRGDVRTRVERPSGRGDRRPAGRGRDLFGAPLPVLTPRFDVTEEAPAPEALTAQRRESSVLFSMNHLKQLCSDNDSPKEEAKGSGLIDIHALTGGAQPAGLMSGQAALTLFPAPPRRRSGWLLPAAGGAALVMLAIIGLLAHQVLAQPVATAESGKRPAGPVETLTPAAAPPTPVVVDEMLPSAKPPRDPSDLPATSSHEVGVAARRPGHPGARQPRVPRRPPVTKTPGVSSTGEKRPRVAARPASEIDRLIDEAARSTDRKPPAIKRPTPRPRVDLPATLEGSHIREAIKTVKARVQGCYDRFHVPGEVRIKLTIGNQTKITRARIVGKFSGTPTGACVLKAIKRAGFPPFAGAPITIVYPFIFS